MAAPARHQTHLQEPSQIPAVREPECSDGGRRVEDDLGPIDAVHEPVEGVVPPVADVHCDPPELCLEHGVAQVSLHVVSGLENKGPDSDASELYDFPLLSRGRKMK